MVNFNYMYIIILITIDILGLNKLWNERFDRRLLHHLQRGIYNKNKIPEYFLNQKLQINDINKILAIKDIHLKNTSSPNTISPFFSSFVSGGYSSKSILNLNDFNAKDKKTLLDIGKKYIPVFEKLINKKLYLTNTKDKCFILRYEGVNTNFSCHYDNEDKSCYRALFLFKRKGDIPKLIIYDENGNKHKINQDVGDGIFFKGKYTYHCVENTTNENSLRYIISYQYTTNKNHYHKSLCSTLSYSMQNIIKELLPKIIIYWIVFCIINFTTLKKYKFNIKIDILLKISIFMIIFLIIISRFTSKYIGTGSPLNITIIFKYYVCLLLFILDPTVSLFYLFYLLTTENLLPKNIIKYD